MSTFFGYDSGRNPVTQPPLTANEQVFLNSDQVTSVTSATANVNTFTTGSPGTISVGSTASFTTGGGAVQQTVISTYNPNYFPMINVATADGVALLYYTGTTSTSFTGCVYMSGQPGIAAVGSAVTNPQTNYYGMSGVASRLVGSIFSDQAGTLAILQSFDGINWDIGNTIAVAANTVSSGFDQETIAPFISFLYSNGAAAQGVFRFSMRMFGNGRQGA